MRCPQCISSGSSSLFGLRTVDATAALPGIFNRTPHLRVAFVTLGTMTLGQWAPVIQLSESD